MRTVRDKLTKNQQEELFIKLAKALALLNKPEEVAQFLKDLLSEPEVLMLGRRLQIAELLIEGRTFDEIRQDLKVGFNTIMRVQTWLTVYGEGYRIVIKRIGKKLETSKDLHDPWEKHKRRYPAYYWPQLLLEEVVKSANAREKQRLKKVVAQLKDKTQLSKQLTKLLQYS